MKSNLYLILVMGVIVLYLSKVQYSGHHCIYGPHAKSNIQTNGLLFFLLTKKVIENIREI